jgi:hypothetical protein
MRFSACVLATVAAEKTGTRRGTRRYVLERLPGDELEPARPQADQET